MFKAKRNILSGIRSGPSDDEMVQMRSMLQDSREAIASYGPALSAVTQASLRQREVVEKNHLAPSFARALGRSVP